MSQTIIIGVDPGKSGGIAILAGRKVKTHKMPESATDLVHLMRGYQGLQIIDGIPTWAVAFVEKVNAGPKMGSSASFKFGQNVGEIRVAILAASIRLEYVSPQKWQKEFGLIVKGRGLGQDDTSKKNRNKARAQELFPGVKMTHAIADAILIAEYGRRVARTLPAPEVCTCPTPRPTCDEGPEFCVECGLDIQLTQLEA